MNMLLPSKKEIDRSKQLEMKMDIDQGKALSQNLEKMRRLFADEEAAIKKARTKMREELQKETEEYIGRRDSAKKEAEQALDAVQQPWVELRNREKDILQREDAVRAIADEQEEERKSLASRKAAMDSKEYDIEKLHTSAKEASDEAESIRNKAILERKASREVASSRNKAADEKMAEAMRLFGVAEDKNRLADERSMALDVREHAQMREQQRLSEKERDIIDREETLQRELARNINKII